MRKDAQENLERVLAAARACFAEHGAGVTMEEVAQRAGVGTGTLYRRFPSRAALVEALYTEAISEVGAAAAQLAANPDPWEALSRWCGAYVELLATKRTLLSELEPLFARQPDLLEAQRKRARATFAGFLQRAQAAGTARAEVDAADVIALLNTTIRAGGGAGMLAIVLAGIRSTGGERARRLRGEAGRAWQGNRLARL